MPPPKIPHEHIAVYKTEIKSELVLGCDWKEFAHVHIKIYPVVLLANRACSGGSVVKHQITSSSGVECRDEVSTSDDEVWV